MTSHFKYLVMDGKIVPFENATLHILTPAVRYATSAFEGIRAYWNEVQQQVFLFRPREHMTRLLHSARLMGMQAVDYSEDDLIRIIVELMQANVVRQDAYIRPNLFLTGEGGSSARGPVSLGIAMMPRGRYAERPFRLAISSWRRIDDNSMSPRIKCAANYQNGRMALIQAKEDGYDGALMLDAWGHVAEEPRACFFMSRRGNLATPPITGEILESITRDTLIQLFREEHGVEVQEREVDRTEVYIADEAFLCGTALEIVSIGEVDHFLIGNGTPGPITTTIQKEYIEMVRGKNDLHPEWRVPVY